MGSFKQPRVFQPLDLEVIDLVYAAVWAQVEAREPFRDRKHDNELRAAIRKWIIAFAGYGPIDFDILCDKLIVSMPGSWLSTRQPRRSSPEAAS
jgi:hypothetical protein